jgi:hypothetical protein
MAKSLSGVAFAGTVNATASSSSVHVAIAGNAIAALLAANRPDSLSIAAPIDGTGTARKRDWIIASASGNTGDEARARPCRIMVPFCPVCSHYPFVGRLRRS